MLLFPSTCADAAGVHSLFDDPLAVGSVRTDHPAVVRYAVQFGMTVAELERHVAMGHIILPADAYAEPATAAPALTGEIDPCPSNPTFRDLPETMMMDLVTSAAVVVDTDTIEAPVSRLAHHWPGVQRPNDHLADPESPPPRPRA
jgi:hypothetical protein